MSKKSNPKWLLILIAGLCVVLAAIVIFMIFKQTEYGISSDYYGSLRGN